MASAWSPIGINERRPYRSRRVQRRIKSSGRTVLFWATDAKLPLHSGAWRGYGELQFNSQSNFLEAGCHGRLLKTLAPTSREKNWTCFPVKPRPLSIRRDVRRSDPVLTGHLSNQPTAASFAHAA